MRITSLVLCFPLPRAFEYSPTHLLKFESMEFNKLDLKTGSVAVEITETLLMGNFQLVTEKLKLLKERGFSIHLDDFGTGYSSLSMINKIPLDALKIDMIFIRNAFTSQNDNQMIKIIIDIASYLKVPTIAEGVETIEQVAVLKTLGCDIVQGYYFSKPIPADEFKKFIIEKK